MGQPSIEGSSSSGLSADPNEDRTRDQIVDSLQALNRQNRRSRLIDVGGAVARVALIASLFFFLLEQRRAGNQERLEARSELSDLIREINNIPLEQAILISDIGEHNSALVGASITGRQLVLMEQAEAILARYPEDATALDYFVLGEANSRATNYATAERNYQKALELPLTPQTDSR